MGAVYRCDFRYVAALEFSSQRVLRRQKTLRGIGECLPDSQNAGVVWWNQPVSTGQVGCSTHSRRACRYRKSRVDQLAPREQVTHQGFRPGDTPPVIIARTFFTNPAMQ